MKAMCHGEGGVCVQCNHPFNTRRTCGEYLRERGDASPATTLAAEPSLWKMRSNYKSAKDRWREAGEPTRSEEAIAAILKICRSNECGNYTDDGRPRCRLCGCSVNNSPDGLKNKIAMATESCPANPPLWTADVVTLAEPS